jgi:hypothetical protein
MAGDISYLNIMDNDNNIIKQFYIGKMRYYSSIFSLDKYKYHDDSPNIYIKDKYDLLKRKSFGKETYSLLNFITIDIIRKNLLEIPINKEEEEAYEDMENFINFIDENMDLIKTNNYNLIFYTEHDF